MAVGRLFATWSFGDARFPPCVAVISNIKSSRLLWRGKGGSRRTSWEVLWAAFGNGLHSFCLFQRLEINYMALPNGRLGWKIFNCVPRKKRKQVYRHTTLPWYIYQQEKKCNLLRVLESVSNNFSVRNWKCILTSVLQKCIWYSSRLRTRLKDQNGAMGLTTKQGSGAGNGIKIESRKCGFADRESHLPPKEKQRESVRI